MNKRFFLLWIVCFLATESHCKETESKYKIKLHSNLNFYQQYQIDFMQQELAELKLQAKIQPKIFAIQKIADEIQLKSDLNYYAYNQADYTRDIKKLLISITELVEFRWSLFEEYLAGNFIGFSVLSGTCAAICAILVGMTITNNDEADYAFASFFTAGLATLFGTLGYDYHRKSDQAKRISEQLKYAASEYLQDINLYEHFDKNKIISDYFKLLLHKMRVDKLDLFIDSSCAKVIAGIDKDKYQIIL